MSAAAEPALVRRNDTMTSFYLWIEPWAEEFEVRPGVELCVYRGGDTSRPLDLEEGPGLLTLFAPGGSKLEVRLDGDLQRSIAGRVPALDTGTLSTREFVGVVFAGAPAAPPASDPLPKPAGWLAKIFRR